MKNIEEIWKKVLSLLEENQHITSTAINAWLVKLVPLKMEGDSFYVGVPEDQDNMIKNVIMDRYSEKIQLCLEEIFSSPFTLVVYGPNEFEKTENEPLSVRDTYTFDNFVVGKNNEFAHAAALAVTKNPSKKYNPLFIYGRSGLGKTHLISAIENEIRKNSPEKKIVYIQTNDWISELRNVIHNASRNSNGRDEFQKKYRFADVFLMDDVQAMKGMDFSQEELFNTFNTLFDSGKQIIFTSDRPPNELVNIATRLTTRFAGGLTVDIKPPDYETRMVIIEKKTASMGIELGPTILKVIAEGITTDIRSIEGYLNRILVYRDLLGTNLSEETILSVINDIFKEQGDIVPTPAVIIDVVATYFNLDSQTLRGQRRDKEINNARQIAIYLIRNITEKTFQEIASEFNRDHSTIISSNNNIERRLQSEPLTSDIIDSLRETIYNKYEEFST
ncbi:MAG: chromosomal replication initiator protein DnaA [Eubacteriales bacterium]